MNTTIEPTIMTCNYCKGLDHNKWNCPVSKAKAERTAKNSQISCHYCKVFGHYKDKCPLRHHQEIMIANKKKIYDLNFPSITTDIPVVKFVYKRDPIFVQEIEAEDKNVRAQAETKRQQALLEIEQEKFALDKAHWLKIKPIITAMKQAFPLSWVDKIKDSPFDTNEARKIRDKNKIKVERLNAQLNAEYEKILQHQMAQDAKIALMTPEEKEQYYKDLMDTYDNENSECNHIQYRKHHISELPIPRRECRNCQEYIEYENKSEHCLPCILNLLLEK